MENPGFIVIEGSIGVGKTSLAKRLAETFGSELLLEAAADNPFLERFYRNPGAAAMQTQFFHYYDEAPLLIVNAAEINLVDNTLDYQTLLEQMQLTTSGRHFFNPVPEVLTATTSGGAA